MFYLADIIAFGCLFMCGYVYGYYVKYADVYDNRWQHWYALLGTLAVLVLASGWTWRKRKLQQYGYNHFYLILYGLLCYLVCGCFMLSENLAIAFYFGFTGLGIVYIACYSYISLRSSSAGYRPARIALGNAMYYGGLTTGFAYFNEFETFTRGLVCLCASGFLLLCLLLNELLQHFGMQQYKQSLDLVFQLLNEERLVFAQRQAILSQFVDRQDYVIGRNRQWLIATLGYVLLLARLSCICSPAYVQLMWRSTLAYTHTSQLYAPFALYAIGCALGAGLLMRYKPKLIFLLVGLVQITLFAAVLCMYADDYTENCFFFLCFLYPTLGICASYAHHWLLECTPLLYTELYMALAYALELLVLEGYQYAHAFDTDVWPALLGSSIAAIGLTVISMLLVQYFLPDSVSLIEVRNQLLGIRRSADAVALAHATQSSKIWHTNHFLQQHDRQLHRITLDKTRQFQQYPKY